MQQRPDGAVPNEQALAARHLCICRHGRGSRLVLCKLRGSRGCAPTAYGPTAFCWARLRIWFRYGAPLRAAYRCQIWLLRPAS